jgi:PAS domain
LVKDARAVLDDLAPIRREVRSRGNGWYDVRLRPYRTIEDKIDGVVVTFLDVTDRHRMEEALREFQSGEQKRRTTANDLKPFVAIQRVRRPPGQPASQPEASLAREWQHETRSVGEQVLQLRE